MTDQQKMPAWEAGQTLWITSDSETSEFEEHIAELLKNFKSKNDIYLVKLFSWNSRKIPAPIAINEHLPKHTESLDDRLISFFHVGEELKVEIPRPSISHSNEENCAGFIKITTDKYQFENETLLIVACTQEDFEKRQESLIGLSDTIGLLSLMFGQNIQSREIFTKFFNAKTKKFISGEIKNTESHEHKDMIVGLRSYYQFEKINFEDDISHAALWFSGKAFVSRDDASKIVYYHTAVEVVADRSKSYENLFNKMYKKFPDLKEFALKQLKELKDLRGKLLHKGQAVSLNCELERYIQIIILDALIYKQKGVLERSGLNNVMPNPLDEI